MPHPGTGCLPVVLRPTGCQSGADAQDLCHEDDVPEFRSAMLRRGSATGHRSSCGTAIIKRLGALSLARVGL